MQAAFVSLIGRPSSGKSTFVNRVCGGKVSIVSPVPQTTRNRIRGIHTESRGQLVFVDTPGFHLSERRMNLHLKEVALNAVKEVDLVLYLVDVSRPVGEEERALMRMLREHREAVVVGLNKIDSSSGDLEPPRAALAELLEPAAVVPLSALTGEGVPEVLAALFALAPEGQRFYPEDFYTDQSPEFRITEIIRERAIHHTKKEVPHALYVEVSDAEMRGESQLWVRGFIYVERESQKAILVGRNGDRIRAIVREAEAELAELFPYAVRLDIRVKTRPKWRKNEPLLRRLIT